MRILLVKSFRRFQRREGITDKALAEAVARAEKGLIDAPWLRDLRMRCEAVQHLAPDCDYSHRCLQSILAGVGRPRLA